MNATDIIVLIVVVIIIAAAVKGSIKHFKGEGPCCGGGSGELPPEKKKLDGPVLGKKVIHITGMHCENCANRVTKAINKIDGASAEVNLHKKRAVVSYDRSIADDALRKAVTDAGYQVESIED